MHCILRRATIHEQENILNVQPNSMQTDSGQFVHTFHSLSSPFTPLKNVLVFTFFLKNGPIILFNQSSGLYPTLKPSNETYNESRPESAVIVVIYANEHIDKSTE